MTNNDPITTAAMTSTVDRRLAQIRREKELFANPILPAVVNRPAPRARRHSVSHRAIR